LAGIPGLSRTFTYGVDGEGRPATASDSAGTTLVSSTNYNAASQVTGLTFGSADADAFAYDPNTGCMSAYNYKVGSPIQTVTGSMNWNANGTLQELSITDPFNAGNTQTCDYGYDDLARVSGVNCGSVFAQTFSFDPFGNVSKSGSFSWLPGYNQSTNRYTLAGTSYDANGNVLNDTINPYTWDSDGKPHSLGDVTVTGRDALGRSAEFAGGVTNEHVYGPTGEIAMLSAPLNTNGALYQAYIPLPGGAQAVYDTTGLLFYNHVDWLGTSRLATTPARAVYFDQAYAPYGESYARNISPSDPPLEFAGLFKHTKGTQTSYFDTPNREYEPIQGRWISPDPAGLGAVDPSNPQS